MLGCVFFVVSILRFTSGLLTEESCGAKLPDGSQVWRNETKVVDLNLPRLVATKCSEPSCSLTTALYSHISIQLGDSVRLLFRQQPPVMRRHRPERIPSIRSILPKERAVVQPEHELTKREVNNDPENAADIIIAVSETTDTVTTIEKSVNEEPKPTLPPFRITSKTLNLTRKIEAPLDTPASKPLLPGTATTKSDVVIARISSITRNDQPKTKTVDAVIDEGVNEKHTTTSGNIGSNQLSILLKSDPAREKTSLSIYKVNDKAFESCDKTAASEVVSGEFVADGDLLLEPGRFSPGNNYFIGIGDLWGDECLKIFVTVKTADCGERSDCHGNGYCISVGDSDNFSCLCCPTASSYYCDVSSPCLSRNPCRNGGLCVTNDDKPNDVSCICQPGFSGDACEDSVADPCYNVTCTNGGSCVATPDNTTHCACPKGYVGEKCDVRVPGCESAPCRHGICMEEEYGYQCFCQPGYGGRLCDVEYNECDSSPCKHGATCLDLVGKFECRCSPGYSGVFCDIKTDLCEKDPCGRDRICQDHGDNYTCDCLPGYSGPSCTDNISVCNPSPCRHGGTCWVSGDSFFCACRPGYAGDTCQDFLIDASHHRVEHNLVHQNSLEMVDMPFGLHLSHKHSAYVAVITLGSAILIALMTVACCYCRQSNWKANIREIVLEPAKKALSKRRSGSQLRDPLTEAIEIEECSPESARASRHPRPKSLPIPKSHCRVYESSGRKQLVD